jgi:DNA polymerase III subunit gamma/tau
MLGIADRGLVFDLFETVLKGDAKSALQQIENLYQGGADPLMVMQDLLDLTHFVTRLKLAPEAGSGDPLEEGDRERARPLAAALSMPVLTRAWQMLLKGIEEVQTAPMPGQAAEMVLIRLAYVADLPVPADLVRQLSGVDSAAVPAAPTRPEPPAPQSSVGPSSGSGARRVEAAGGGGMAPAPVAMAQPQPIPPQTAPNAEYDAMPQNFVELIALFDKRREALIRSHLWSHVHLVAFEPGRIELRPREAAPRDLANRLGQLLGEWTGARWVIAVSQAEGAPTLAEAEAQQASAVRNEVAAHPLVRAVLDTFPGATIAAVRERFSAAEPAATGSDEAAPAEDAEAGPGDETSLGEDGP